MNKKNISLFLIKSLLLLCIVSSFAQETINFEDYAGLWKGEASTNNSFELTITIEGIRNSNSSIVISNGKELLRKKIKLQDTITIPLGKKLYFEGITDKETSTINGFVKLGIDFYPISLHKKGASYTGKWNLNANHYLQTESHYLEIRKVYNSVEGYGAYPVLGTYWVNNFKLDDDKISFIDYKTRLLFIGKLDSSQITLGIFLDTIELGKIHYQKVNKKENGKLVKIEDGWTYDANRLQLSPLEKDINTNMLKGIESVLVAKNGKIIYENYFNGTNTHTTNDLRSAGKSIGSVMIGIAIDDGIITSTKENIYDYLPKAYQYTKDEEKSKITIEQLLTMSSGIGVYEDNYQQTNDWLKTVLEPKLKYDAGTRTNYMSADPFLLSVNLSERLSYPLEFYMHQKLFAPLGIKNYILNTDDKGNPYFAGGTYLTPRDMLKFGQLYLNKGTWNGKRVISKKWVEQSFKKHTRLENTSKKNQYGYFWWHETYKVKEKSIATIEARGNGGQYISIIPELNTVIVITTENYNKRGAAKQTEKIITDYVLSNLIKN